MISDSLLLSSESKFRKFLEISIPNSFWEDKIRDASWSMILIKLESEQDK